MSTLLSLPHNLVFVIACAQPRANQSVMASMLLRLPRAPRQLAKRSPAHHCGLSHSPILRPEGLTGALSLALDQIAASTQTVMGIEMREDDVPEGTPSPSDASTVLLTGMPLKNAFDVLVNFDRFN